MDDSTDTELVKQFRHGNTQAFNRLVNRHQDRVYRLACMHLYQQQDAMDAVQEVFLRAYKGLQGFRFQSEPFTWIYRTLLNVCKEMNRKQDKTKLHHDNPDEAMLHLPANDNTEQRQLLIEVRQLTNKLPARQREVILLRIFEDLSVEETAKIMKCRQGTVKALLNKARTQLRQLNEVSHVHDR